MSAGAGAAGDPRPPAAPVPPDRASPFGLYVHFPFCAARCHYCAFYFVVGRGEARPAYVDAVRAEIAGRARDPRFAGRRVHSIYLGGGTPSLLDPAEVGRLIDAAAGAFPLAEDAEISLEANPDGLERGPLEGFRAAGANRITLGWQSLRAEGLRSLTRTHSVEENVRALQVARAAGFANVAVDLIFGRPGQTPSDWRAELDEAAALGVEHLSAYELTLEEGTRLARRFAEGRFAPADEDARAEMFEAADDVLARHGIRRYEISNFARAGRECRHNLASWQGGDTLGVGASAASHVANARWTNVADLDDYVRRARAGEEVAGTAEVLDETTWAAEDLYLALRTAPGADAARLAAVSAPARDALERKLARMEDGGVLRRDAGRLRLTSRGRLLADGVLEELLDR
jgi:oxygen-independent coproporphyrinogen-3 oxidase